VRGVKKHDKKISQKNLTSPGTFLAPEEPTNHVKVSHFFFFFECPSSLSLSPSFLLLFLLLLCVICICGRFRFLSKGKGVQSSKAVKNTTHRAHIKIKEKKQEARSKPQTSLGLPLRLLKLAAMLYVGCGAQRGRYPSQVLGSC
jgi:hypothetical protein